jgi:hypothetical protein
LRSSHTASWLRNVKSARSLDSYANCLSDFITDQHTDADAHNLPNRN